MKILAGILTITILINLIAGCVQEKSKEVTKKDKSTKAVIKMEGERFQLYVDDKPFYIKGAGLEFGDIPALAKHGGNSFRTWTTNNGQRSGKEVLDEAWEHGLYVMMGIDVARERHGFDYNNKEAVAIQFERIKAEVQKLKDHPAIIIWAIGNELNLRATNSNVWNAVNDLSKMIHEIDPHHLTTTTIAGFSKELIRDIKTRASDLDVLSIQLYADIVNLPKYIQDSGWEEPYIVTEWGATGHWEVARTEWNAPIENNSTVKANFYHDRFKTSIEPFTDQCLGSYVFLWGQKQERTPTWYGLFMKDGSETESVDVMHLIWNGQWPSNRSPQLLSFTLDGKTAYENVHLRPGKRYDVVVSIQDHDGDRIDYFWDVKPESTDLGEGGDFETTPESIDGLVQGEGSKVTLRAPSEVGAYRLFIYAKDRNGHTAHANIPFFVN